MFISVAFWPVEISLVLLSLLLGERVDLVICRHSTVYFQSLLFGVLLILVDDYERLIL